jgi:hypothetical protein
MQLSFAVLILLGSSFTTAVPPSVDGKGWLALPPVDTTAVTLIPKQDVCEVLASKMPMAVVTLDSTPVIPLDQIAAISYAGSCAQSSPGTSQYLVRAVYGQRGTGVYSVRRRGDDLLVEHSSLGRTFTYTKSALVVSLPFAPNHVYISVSIDE